MKKAKISVNKKAQQDVNKSPSKDILPKDRTQTTSFPRTSRNLAESNSRVVPPINNMDDIK